MGMFMGSIRNLAGDCESTHRWCLANLTDDDANDSNRQKLTKLRVVKVGQSTVLCINPNGQQFSLDPARIQRVW